MCSLARDEDLTLDYYCANYVDLLAIFDSTNSSVNLFFFFFQAEDGIRDSSVTGVQTCALPISYLRSRNGNSHKGVPKNVSTPHRSLCGFPSEFRVSSSAETCADASTGGGTRRNACSHARGSAATERAQEARGSDEFRVRHGDEFRASHLRNKPRCWQRHFRFARHEAGERRKVLGDRACRAGKSARRAELFEQQSRRLVDCREDRKSAGRGYDHHRKHHAIRAR